MVDDRTTAALHDRPVVQVTTRGPVDPIIVGYALDRLWELVTGRPLDTLRVELARQNDQVRVEVTAELAGGVVRAWAVGGTPRGAIERVCADVAGRAGAVSR